MPTVAAPALYSHAADARAGQHLDALPSEGAGQLFAYVFVLQRHDAGHELDDGDVRAVSAIDVCELRAGRAAAHDDDAGRCVAHLQGVAAGHHNFVVYGQVGQVALARAGGDDYVVCAESLTRLGDCDGVGVFERAGAVDDVHAVLFEQKAYAVGEAGDDLAAAVYGVAEVVLEVVVADAELSGVAEGVQHLGVLEQRLAGDAAPVEADAAERVVFHDGGAHTELAGTNGGHVAARPRA